MNSEAALLLQHLATLGAKRHDQTFALTIELVYPQPRALAEVQRQIAALLPITTPSVRAAFDPQSDLWCMFFSTISQPQSTMPSRRIVMSL